LKSSFIDGVSTRFNVNSEVVYFLLGHPVCMYACARTCILHALNYAANGTHKTTKYSKYKT